MLTLKQIAKLAGVSRSTASRVLNDRPGVHPDVRERVLKVMREQGFHPDPVARSLASRRSTGPDADQPAASAPSEQARQR
jgi:LacI family transcriptional regulator